MSPLPASPKYLRSASGFRGGEYLTAKNKGRYLTAIYLRRLGQVTDMGLFLKWGRGEVGEW